MTTPRRTIARRVQAVVVGLGVAGSLGAAAVIGLSTNAATDAGTSTGTGTGQTTGQQPHRVQPAVRPRGGEGDDNEGGRARTAPARSARQVTPQPAPPAPAPTHATTSGS